MKNGAAELENNIIIPMTKNESDVLSFFLHNEWIDDLIDLHLWPLKALLQALRNECTGYDSVAGNLAAAMVPIVEKAREEIHKSLALVQSKIGDIRTVTVMHNNQTYPKGHCWIEIVHSDGEVTSFGKAIETHPSGM